VSPTVTEDLEESSSKERAVLHCLHSPVPQASGAATAGGEAPSEISSSQLPGSCGPTLAVSRDTRDTAVLCSWQRAQPPLTVLSNRALLKEKPLAKGTKAPGWQG